MLEDEGSKMILRILLVEDDDDHAHIVQRALKNGPYPTEVNRASDGVEALARLRREGQFLALTLPDLVLLDLKLPRLDGHEVLATIKNDPDTSALPVIILTTSDAAIDMVKAYEHRANSYLVKPLDAAGFRNMMEDFGRYWGQWNQSLRRLKRTDPS